jgi:hypothetical protein
MSKNVTEKIKDKAFELLKDNPDGLRYSELVKFISENDEKLNRNTINGSIWNLDSQFPEKVYKPSRGLFRLVEFKDPETDELRKEVQPKEAKKIKEEDFYEPFSNWLQWAGIVLRINGVHRTLLGKKNQREAILFKHPLKSYLLKSKQRPTNSSRLLVKHALISYLATNAIWLFPNSHLKTKSRG